MIMLSRVRSRLTYANLMATLAVFVALGGTSYAVATGSIDSREIKNNSVTGRDVRNSSLTGADVRNNRLTGADINEARLGTVPSANTANSAATATTATDATNATNATNATDATNATNATNASTAINANALGGIDSSGYVKTPTEPTRLVGTPGNPPFESGFANFGLGEDAGFYKDQFGIVHLQGDLSPPGSSSTIFTLPPGYRPIHGGATGPQFAVRADGSIGFVEVRSDGQVNAVESYNTFLSLNGLTFRAEQ